MERFSITNHFWFGAEKIILKKIYKPKVTRNSDEKAKPLRKFIFTKLLRILQPLGNISLNNEI